MFAKLLPAVQHRKATFVDYSADMVSGLGLSRGFHRLLDQHKVATGLQKFIDRTAGVVTIMVCFLLLFVCFQISVHTAVHPSLKKLSASVVETAEMASDIRFHSMT